MNRITCVSLVFGVTTLLLTGCATNKYPKTLTLDTAARVKSVALLDEISTPAFLDYPNSGSILVSIVRAATWKDFTTEVRANLDFQKFAEETLRESFSKALKDQPGWTLVASNDLAKADAAFLVKVVSMGVDQPIGFPPKYKPMISISATLIGNPPFEIVRSGGGVQILDPTNHPILYQRLEVVSWFSELPPHSKEEYSSSPAVFMDAFREAIDLAVSRIAASWTTGELSH